MSSAIFSASSTRLHRVGGAGDDRDAGVLHQLAGAGLGAHRLDRRRGRPDERDAGLLEALGERGVLGQEAVAGVDGLGAGGLDRLHDLVHVEVGLGRRARAEQVGLARALDVLGVAIRLAVDGHGGDAELVERADHAHRDLAAVGDQNLGEHGARWYPEGLAQVSGAPGVPAHMPRRGRGAEHWAHRAQSERELAGRLYGAAAPAGSRLIPPAARRARARPRPSAAARSGSPLSPVDELLRLGPCVRPVGSGASARAAGWPPAPARPRGAGRRGRARRRLGRDGLRRRLRPSALGGLGARRRLRRLPGAGALPAPSCAPGAAQRGAPARRPPAGGGRSRPRVRRQAAGPTRRRTPRSRTPRRLPRPREHCVPASGSADRRQLERVVGERVGVRARGHEAPPRHCRRGRSRP